MAKRRSAWQRAAGAIGDISDLYLQMHLRNKLYEQDDARAMARMKAQQGIDTEQSLLAAAAANPALANRLGRAGRTQLAGFPISTFAGTPQERMTPLTDLITRAGKPSDLPTVEGVIGRAASIGEDTDPVMEMQTRPAVGDELPSRTNAYVLPQPIQQQVDLRNRQMERLRDEETFQDDRSAANKYRETYEQGIASNEAANATFGDVMGRKAMETDLETAAQRRRGLDASQIRVDEYVNLTPWVVEREGGTEMAKLLAQLNPDILERKLDFERRKAMQELALIGDKIAMEEVAKRNAAIDNIKPLYNQYKQLATKVYSSWAGAASPVSGSVQGTISKIPFGFGEFIATALESTHAMSAEMGADPALARDIAALNTITDSLALGMVNTFLGNKGQVTEADKRAAKQLLANSFRDVTTAEKLFEITDRMFTKAPIVAGRVQAATGGDATVAEVLDALRQEIEQPQSMEQVVRDAVAAPAAAPDAALDKLNLLRRQRGQ